MPELINWLQLSDFHCGQKDNDWMQRISDEFCSQFQKIINDRGLPYPDLIIVTGDLAYAGKINEYDIFDSTINKIKSCLPSWNPAILSVPGNHDSDREKVVQNKSNRDSFTNYVSNWCKRNCACSKDCTIHNGCIHCRKRQLGIACSSYPGDYYWQFNLPGKFPFAIVGLNSEFKEDECTDPNIIFNRLEMLKQAAHERGLYPKNVTRKFLLLHHPPLIFKDQEQIFQDININFGNIDICLHGHLHRSQSTIRTISGKTEYQYQVASFCGLEHFGKNSENRSFGFAIGSISRYGEIRVWPFVYEKVRGTEHFVWDRRLDEEHLPGGTEGNVPGILIRKATRPKFDFYQLAEESSKITFIGLFNASPLITYPKDSKRTLDLIDCLESVSNNRNTKLDVTFILPGRSILEVYSSLFKVDHPSIISHWETLIHNIRNFISRNRAIKVRYLEHADVYPIEAVVFDDQYTVYRILGLPGENKLQSDWNDESFGQLISAFNQVKENSSPIMEFNIYGEHSNDIFYYKGIIPQPIWRSNSKSKGLTFPVAICLIVYDNKLVLQFRSQSNSGCDLGKYSLVSNKLIDVDFLHIQNGESVTQFWTDAANVWRNIENTTNHYDQLSEQFSQLLGLHDNRVITVEALKSASIRAMKRCLYSELNLNITEKRLLFAPPGYTKLICKDGFSILVSLFSVNISNDEFSKCALHDNTIKAYDISWLEENRNQLNHFISANINQIKQLMNLHSDNQ